MAVRDDGSRVDARERFAQRIDAAAYGTVLVLAALSAIEVSEVAAGHSSELVLGVGVATWIAHVFAELLAEHVRLGEPVKWRQVRRASRDGAPILISTLLPATLLFLDRLDVVGSETSRNLAILVGVLQLSLIGAVVARSSTAPAPAWRFAALTAGIGIGVVALKVALGH